MFIRKVYYIAVIFMLIAMLAAPDAVCIDSLRPYMQLEKPEDKPDRRQAILRKNKKRLEYLYNLRKAANESEEKVKEVMRESTWNLIETLRQDPSADLQDVVKFDKILYYEFRAALNPDAPTKLAKDLLQSYPEIFSKRYDLDAEKIAGLLGRIFQAAALREMPKKEIVIVKRYVLLPDDSWPEVGDKGDRVKELIKSGRPKLHKKIFYKCCSIVYGFRVESRKWSSEISGPNFICDFGQGDEHTLDGGLKATSGLALYVEESNLMHETGWADIGTARHYILNQNIPEAIKKLKELLDRYEQKANPAIRETLLWMHENGLPGIGQIVEALGMDEICVEEFVSIVSEFYEFYDKEIVPIILKLDSAKKGIIARHILGEDKLANAEGYSKDVKAFGVLYSKLLEFSNRCIVNVKNVAKVFLSEEAFSGWVEVLSKSDNPDRKSFGEEMNNNKEFKNDIKFSMKRFYKLIKVKTEYLKEINAYFQMRLEMEQGVGQVLESNKAVDAAI